jgi:hypothetical protein
MMAQHVKTVNDLATTSRLLVKRGRKGRSRAFPEEMREEEAGGSKKG